jgi:alpha/beta superfamily hydrolase
MTFELEGPAGRLEARLDLNVDKPVAVAIVATELGETMQSRVLHNIAVGLLRLDCAVLRFNFRGVGTSEGRPTEGGGEMEDYRAAIQATAERFPGTPIWAVGYSFGSFVAMTTGSQDARVKLLVGVGLLLEDYDYSIVLETDKAKFLIHGEADERCSLKTVRRFYGELLEPRELIDIDGADHAFDGHASELADTIEDLLAGL